MKKTMRAIAPVIAVFLILATAVSARADWYSDVSGGTKVRVTDKDPFVVDTYAGVDSYYSASSSQYTSSELVIRFYSKTFGLSITAGGSGPVMQTDGYTFQTPSTPGVGDIIFSPSTGRWAIIKGVSSKRLTMFEQDTVTDGTALKGRTLAYPSDSYYIYTPRAKAGHNYPVLKDAKTGSVIRTASGGKTNTTAAITSATETTTEKTETSVVTDANTTEQRQTGTTTPFNDYTTYRSYEPETTAAPHTFTTQHMPDGYEQFFTTSKASEEASQTGTGEITIVQEYETDENQDETGFSAPLPEPEDKSIDPTLIFGIAMVAGIAFIVGAGILAVILMKKRNNDDDY